MSPGQTTLTTDAGRKLRMTVRGIPIPQGDMSAQVVHGRAVLYHTNGDDLRPWRKHIREVGLAAMRSPAGVLQLPLDGALRARITFTFERPKTVTRHWPSVPPDLDKLLRAVFDALSPDKKKPAGSVWADDARVVRAEITKLYVGELGALDSPGVSIEVTEIG